MTDILDRIAKSKHAITYRHFRPASADQLFALRLASKLNDALAVAHYVELTNQHAPGHLVVAYRRACALKATVHLARRFHSELERLNGRNGHTARTGRLMAIRIERRTIAIAVFKDLHLEHAQARQLSSSSRKAISSAAMFVELMVERFQAESVVFEAVPGTDHSQRMQIKDVITDMLKSEGTAVTSIPKAEVLEAFGNPAVRSRAELREVISGMWPILDEESGAPYIKDAVALALYIQTECLFNI